MRSTPHRRSIINDLPVGRYSPFHTRLRAAEFLTFPFHCEFQALQAGFVIMNKGRWFLQGAESERSKVVGNPVEE